MGKDQGTRFAEFFQNCVCIGNTRNINVDPVTSLLVHNSLGTVVLYTLLQLVNGIGHFFRCRILIYCLIRDADTAGQVKTQLDIIHGIIAEESEQSYCEQQDQQAQ